MTPRLSCHTALQLTVSGSLQSLECLFTPASRRPAPPAPPVLRPLAQAFLTFLTYGLYVPRSARLLAEANP